MTDKRDTSKAQRTGRQFPPTALEVPECPPHRWLIEGKWQECRKCGARMEVPQPAPASSARSSGRRAAPVDEPEPIAEIVEEAPTEIEAPEVVADIDVVEEPEGEPE